MRQFPENTLWHATTAAGPECRALQDDLHAEVAIIGGGFLGLSAALRLAQRGASVVLLEAGELGAGASGRNAGFVVPHFSRADPAMIQDALPAQFAERLLRLVERGGEQVFRLTEQIGMGGQTEQTGWLQPAHSPKMAEALEQRTKEWQQRGRPVRWLSASETQAQTGMSIYHGALCDSSGGMINPLALVRGLARLALNGGARVYTRTPVARIVPQGAQHVIHTAQGRVVRADHVIVATNSGTHGVAAELGRSVLPLQVYQIATRPLDTETVARIAPNRIPVSDTRTNIFTYRLDAENRLISGGMALIPLAAEKRMAKRIATRLATELKLESIPGVEYVWRGTAAVSRDGLPSVVSIGANIWGATGCNGRGVAFTNMLGASLADWILSGADPNNSPLPVSSAAVLPFRGLGRMAPSAVLLKAMVADWIRPQKGQS